MSNDNTRYGAIIKFPAHLTEEQCEDILARMVKAGYCEPGYNTPAPPVMSYNPDHGSPVWYIP